jgi:Bacterial membrane protein YfhO
MLRGLKLATGITGGIVLLVLIIPGIAGSFLSPMESDYPAWLTSALVADRKELLRADSLRSLIFILLGATAVFGFVTGKLRKEYSIVLIALLIVFDLWGAGKRYLDADRFERPSAIQKSFAPTIADAEILKDKSYHRVLNLTVSIFNDNSPTSWFHKSIGGYHGAKLKRYQELIDSSISRELALFQSAFRSAEQARTVNDLLPVILPVFNKTAVLNMLNSKYVIIDTQSPPVVNPRALGNAWFVEKPVIAENANMELAYTGRIDPSTEAVIDARFRDQVTVSSYPVNINDTIELVSYQPNELEYKYTAEGEKLAVFSEIYYPAGWKCYIDGAESKYFRANYVLRGMILPAGTHQVKFTFAPSSYINGNKISLASSVLLILITAGYLISRSLRKSKSV